MVFGFSPSQRLPEAGLTVLQGARARLSLIDAALLTPPVLLIAYFQGLRHVALPTLFRNNRRTLLLSGLVCTAAPATFSFSSGAGTITGGED